MSTNNNYKDRGMQFSEASPDDLVPNPWNPNIVDTEGESRIEASLDELGICDPIKVREIDDGQLEIIGGEHRVAIFKRNGVERIPILNFGPISDSLAKKISLIDNGRYGTDDATRLRPLLEEIQAEVGDLHFLPYSDDELTGVLSAGDIQFDDITLDEDDGDIESYDDSPTKSVQTHQIMRFKVPVDDAEHVKAIIDELIKTNRLNEQDSLTNAGDALMIIINQYKNNTDD